MELKPRKTVGVRKTHTKKPTRFKWKPTSIPDGFILKIDTREQSPLFLPTPPKGLVVVRDTVQHGDYTILGFEDKVGIERKQVSDFFTYVGKERDRTIRKLTQIKELDFAALVVEADEEEVLSPYQLYSTMHPEQIRGFLRSLRVRYGVHVYFNSNRSALERWVLDHLAYFFELYRGLR